MTDARIPERWLSDRRVLRLSDRGFRFFVLALTWSVANRTDGVIEAVDIPMMPGTFTGADPDELVTAGIVTQASETSWSIVDFDGTQTSSRELEILENMRRRERVKKAKQRAAAAARADQEGTVPGDSPGAMSPGTAQDRQDRQDRQALEGRPRTNGYGVGECAGCGGFLKLGPDDLCNECVVPAIAEARAAV